MISKTNVNASNASTPSTASRKVGFRDEPGVRTVERKSLPDVSRFIPTSTIDIDISRPGELRSCDKTVARVRKIRPDHEEFPPSPALLYTFA